MSAEATGYVTALLECPDGADLDCAHKAILWCLADHHNRSTKVCEPGLPRIQRESRVTPSSLKRCLTYLEYHGVIERVKPPNQGRGEFTRYLFLALDYPDRLAQKLEQLQKGPTDGPLFKTTEGAQKGPKHPPERGPEGAQGRLRNKEEPITKILTIEPSTARAALKVWFLVKLELEKHLPAEEVKLWVKPARLQRVAAGQHMLIALPPANRIIQAAYARLQMLRELLAVHHYSASFVKYADEYDRQLGRERFGIEVQTYGNGKPATATRANSG